MSDRQHLPTWSVIGILTFIVIAGITLRVMNLGGPDFTDDELLHVFAAQQLLDGNGSKLPSGIPNPRALVYTHAVAISGRFWELDEWGARLPSVLFGSLSIVMVFHMTRRWYTNGAALIAAFLVAIAPMELAYSRHVRMYSLFQLVYLAFIYLCYQAFETSSPKPAQNRILQRLSRLTAALEIRPLLLPLIVGLFLLGVHLQALMFAAATGPTTYVIVMAAVAAASPSWPRTLKLKYGVTALTAMLGIAFLTVFTGIVTAALELAQYVPIWARNSADHWRYYVWALTDSHPIVFGTFALGALYGLTRNPKATTYVVVCFVTPFLLHSAFAWKHPRYIFHIIPLLYIVFGVALGGAISAVSRMLYEWIDQRDRPRMAKTASSMVAVAAGVFLLMSMGEFRQGIKFSALNEGDFMGEQRDNWKNAMRFVTEHGTKAEAVIARSPALAMFYAPGRILYCLDGQTLRQSLEEPPRRDNHGGLTEYVVGTPIIADIKMFHDVLSRHPVGWLVVERRRFLNPDVVSADVRELIEKTFELQEVPQAGDMVVWKWNTTDIGDEL